MSESGQPQYFEACGCPNATNPRDFPVTTTNDAMAALVEVVRVQANALLTLIEHNKPLVAVPASSQPRGREIHGMVISERVGSISVEHWEEMSKDSLGDLDRALERIIDTVMISSISWNQIANTIHSELAAVGFRFKTAGECLPLNQDRDWAEAATAKLSRLVRARAAASAARSDAGTSWWVDEMMRILVRLIELRGM